jgi:hypothetical protein
MRDLRKSGVSGLRSEDKMQIAKRRKKLTLLNSWIGDYMSRVKNSKEVKDIY